MTEACANCRRRSWLLAMLSARLAYQAGDRGRLLELLALEDEELVGAIGGARRQELRERHASFQARSAPCNEDAQAICRHHPDYPNGLMRAGQKAPRMLHLAGAVERLGELGERPIVAIVGTRQATDYGMEMARSLARGLTASGVTVAGSLSDGIAVAAQEGALEVEGATITVMDGGLDVSCPARRRVLHKRLLSTGCLVAELPCGCTPRKWCYPARERIVAALAQLTIVVEADEHPADLLGACVARALGRTVAAVPGRVTSPVSRGTHALLLGGAALVRGPGDALELLHASNSSLWPRDGRDMPEEAAPIAVTPAVGASMTRALPTRTSTTAGLEPRLRRVLEQVGAGRDTPAQLTAGSEAPAEMLLALSELELMGLLTRGDGDRYVPRESLAGTLNNLP
jgi:DNA processing protein